MMDVEARREARRRKILENADKRLKRITNIQNNESEDHGEHNLEPIEAEIIEDEFLAVDTVNEEDLPELPEIFQNRVVQRLTREVLGSPTLTRNADNKKSTQVIVLIGLAVFTRMLQFLVTYAAKSDGEMANKVFAPFILYEFMDVLIIKTEVPSIGLMNMLVFFGNIPPHISSKIIGVFNLFSKIVRDALVFFFVYVIVDITVGKIYE